jgi:uncharacterized protein YgbK (DUF1537 family)
MVNRGGVSPQIAVLADDFTGAAEIAELGLRYGLKTELQTQLCAAPQIDLLVLDTDSRSLAPAEAAGTLKTTLEALKQLRPDWIYMKVDSVLRGPVAAQLEAAMATLGKERTLLVPANPSRRRCVRNGRYFVEGKPLDRTQFANDPEHPATYSDVLELLGHSNSLRHYTLRNDQQLLEQALIVGDAESHDDILAWAARLDEGTLAAGAAEFFAAILQVKGFTPRPPVRTPQLRKRQPALFICTSSSDASRKMVEQARNRGVAVCEMPRRLAAADKGSEGHVDSWAAEVLDCLRQAEPVVVTIGQAETADMAGAPYLRGYTAALVEQMLKQTAVPELCIEGGATASAIVRRLGWKRFAPRNELAPGVVRLKVLDQAAQHITVKPGSYKWPKGIWRRPK